MPVAFPKASLHPQKASLIYNRSEHPSTARGIILSFNYFDAQTFILIVGWKSFLLFNCLPFMDFWLTFFRTMLFDYFWKQLA